MTSSKILGGPVWAFAVVVFVSSWVLGVFTAIDPLRERRAQRFSEIPESKWLYSIPAALYIALTVFAQFANLAPFRQASRAIAVGVAVAAPLMIVLAVVYLLRVVFPASSVRDTADAVDDADSELPG